MGPTKLARAAAVLVLCGVLLGLLAVSQAAWAEEPQLLVQLSDGGSAVYAVSDVDWIGFAAAETLVVVTLGGNDYYPAASIARIQFLWGTLTGVDPENMPATPKVIHLFQNVPNPFSRGTRIGFDLPQGGNAELRIYSPSGQLIRTLTAGQRGVGRHEVDWDGLNNEGRRVASGVYFYSLKAPGILESRRMIVLR